MSQTFQHHGQLAAACAEWAKISLTGLQPRRNLNLSDKKADWKEALSALKRFANSDSYKAHQDFQAHAALENYWKWKEAGEQARWLLIYGIDLGLNGDVLRPIYQEVTALWIDAASVAEQVRASMAQETGEDYGVAPPINTRADDYAVAGRSRLPRAVHRAVQPHR